MKAASSRWGFTAFARQSCGMPSRQTMKCWRCGGSTGWCTRPWAWPTRCKDRDANGGRASHCLTVALGLTAAAHLLAAMIGFVLAVVWMMYLAERRRSYVMQILVFSAVGALAILFAFYAFRLAPFSYVFTGGGARFWFALDGASHFFLNMANAPIVVATLVALLLYIAVPRCRYFGNTAPLVMALLLFPIVTTQTVSQPWLWALPFLFTFVGGVFADVLEMRQRKMFLALSGAILLTQAMLCSHVAAGDRTINPLGRGGNCIWIATVADSGLRIEFHRNTA